MTEIVWEDPPSGKRRARFDGVPEALRVRPGEWARIAEYEKYSGASALASAIRRGETTRWRPVGAFDAVYRLVGGKHCVYARYVGTAGVDR